MIQKITITTIKKININKIDYFSNKSDRKVS